MHHRTHSRYWFKWYRKISFLNVAKSQVIKSFFNFLWHRFHALIDLGLKECSLWVVWICGTISIWLVDPLELMILVKESVILIKYWNIFLSKWISNQLALEYCCPEVVTLQHLCCCWFLSYLKHTAFSCEAFGICEQAHCFGFGPRLHSHTLNES